MSFLGRLFGGSSPQVQMQPQGFNAGGLSTTFGPGGYNIAATPERTGLVSGLSNTFGELGNQYGSLAATVAPGFNDLLRARLGQINDSASAAIGNLRQNLQSRRVLGSSFGQDTISRGEAEFARQRDAATADTFMKSLAASSELLAKQYEAWTKQFSTGLDELNLEAGIAGPLVQNANNVLAQNARTNAELEARSQEGTGRLLGTVGSLALAPFTGGGSLAGLFRPQSLLGSA